MIPFRADILEAIRRTRRQTKIIVGSSLAGFVLAISLGTFAMWMYLFGGMPSIPNEDALWRINRQPAMEFVDRNGVTIGIRGPRYGRPVAAQDMPPYVVAAFLAIEDARFYEHKGVDELGILRAIFANVVHGRTVQGGSTITQQLVKNLLLTPQRTVRRKVQEIVLSNRIEKKFSKDQILTLYLNRIFLGSNAYGVDAAARRYFGKPVTQINLAEAAMLGGLPKAPTRFSPAVNFKEAKARQALVLERMVDAGFIKRADADAAKQQPIEVRPAENFNDFGYAMDFAADRVAQLVDKKSPPDLIVKLSVDAKTQRAGSAAVSEMIRTEGPAAGVSQASMVLLDLDGGVRAMVGGSSYRDSQFNRAFQAKRQPGSAFKTFVYAAAFERGVRPWSIRYDQPVTIQGWSPQNYDNEFHGEMSVREAYARSINTVSAQVANEIGQRKVVQLAHRFGIESVLHPYPSISLGSDVTTNLEMTRGYGVLATGGLRLDPYIVEQINSPRGQLVYQRKPYEKQRVYADDLARLMNGMMRAVVVSGTGRRAGLADRDAAGKTGTSTDYKDAWFVGFTGDFVGGVWVGNDNNKSMNKITGGSLPAGIWHTVLTAASEGLPAKPLLLPPDTGPAEGGLSAFYEDLAAAFAAVANSVEGPDEPPTPVQQ
ncbi:MAG: PBP1A family penicillin-binding protein [Caulobacterales bacterium]